MEKYKESVFVRGREREKERERTKREKKRESNIEIKKKEGQGIEGVANLAKSLASPCIVSCDMSMPSTVGKPNSELWSDGYIMIQYSM